MNNKKTVVLFEKDKLPRIYINPKSLSELQERGTILVNPQIPKGVPLEKWFIKNGRISYSGQIPQKLKDIVKPKDDPKFKILIVMAVAFLFSIQIYEKRELVKNTYNEIIQKLK